MSDSEGQSQVVPDARIASALRDEVARCFQDDDLDNLTVKRVRASAVKKLGLAESFFRDNARWFTRSKEVIGEEVSRHENNNGQEQSVEASLPASAEQPEAKGPTQKRKTSQLTKKPNKRQKKSPQASDTGSDHDDHDTVPAKGRDSTSELSESRSASPLPKPTKKTPDHSSAKQPQPSLPSNSRDDDLSSELSDVQDVEPPSKPKQAKPGASKEPGPKFDDDDTSELSEVQDPDPPPKKSRKKRESVDRPAKSSKAAKPTSKAKVDSTISPQDEEIKRLQSQLVKCGIRKVWGKELKPFDTPKAKIAHLKSMLEDAGMKGRFSEEKARQIKEARELKADIEAIEEGNKMWGMAEKEGEERPRRVQVARGLEELDQFADEESESD